MSKNSSKQELVHAVITCALVQHLEEATRYDLNSESALLDLIWGWRHKPHCIPSTGKWLWSPSLWFPHRWQRYVNTSQTKRPESKYTRYYTLSIPSKSDNRTRIPHWNGLWRIQEFVRKSYCTGHPLVENVGWS